MEKLRRGFFPFLIAISALSVSASAAFYSVSGLSKLFAGASLEVMIMAGSLEAAKLVIASLLYQYWDKLNKLLRAYLTMGCVILVLITSMGIYGFLSAAYQETYQKLSVSENKIAFLDEKSKFYEEDIQRYDRELETIINNISKLSSAKTQSIQVRDTTTSTGYRQTISTAELRLARQRINEEELNKKAIQVRRQEASDSLQKYRLEVLELQTNSETVGELGPLQYLSGLTGTPMDKIINILLLVIIFVFDPLAISLVVAANFAFKEAFQKTVYGEYDDIYADNLPKDKYPDVFTPPVTGSVPEGMEFDKEYKVKKKMTEEEAKEFDKTIQAYPLPVKESLHDDDKPLPHPLPVEDKDWKVVDENNKEIKTKIPRTQRGVKGGRPLVGDGKGRLRPIDDDSETIKYM